MWHIPICLMCCTFGAFAIINDEIYLGFQKYGIEPEIIPFSPMNNLIAVFPDRALADAGNDLSNNDIHHQPDITYDAMEGRYYTLVYINAGVTARLDPNSNQYLQLLVVNIPEENIEVGNFILPFKKSLPKKIEGYPAMNRYVILAYLQCYKLESNITQQLKSNVKNRTHISIADMLFQYNMTVPQFGNFFVAEYKEDPPKIKKTTINKYQMNHKHQDRNSTSQSSEEKSSGKLDSKQTNSIESSNDDSSSRVSSNENSSSTETSNDDSSSTESSNEDSSSTETSNDDSSSTESSNEDSSSTESNHDDSNPI